MPDVSPEALPPAQRDVYDAILNGPRGHVPEALLPWLASPNMADLAQKLGAYCRFKTAMSDRQREIAICTVAAYWKAGFEWQAHSAAAAKAGVPQQTLEALRTGQKPAFDRPDEAAVWGFCHELLRERRLSDAAFARAKEALGEEGLADLIGTIGYYSMISLTILAFDVPLMRPGEDPFAGVR